VTSVFYLFRDAPQRRAALQLEPGSAARYALHGMDQLAERGYAVGHNLERPQSTAWARPAGAALKRGLESAGGYGGDFATVLSSLRPINRADVVFSTVDTVGIPLMLLARARAVRTPFVYAAIGLPDDEILAVIAYLQTLGGKTTVTMQTKLPYQAGGAAEAADAGVPSPASANAAAAASADPMKGGTAPVPGPGQ